MATTEKSYARLCIERANELLEQRDARLIEVFNDYNPDIKWWLVMAREHQLNPDELTAFLESLSECEQRLQRV